MRTYILGVPIDNVTRKEALDRLMSFLHEDLCHIVITPNPEMVMTAQKDAEFMHILKKAALVIPDGTGIVLASLMERNRLKQRVTGCDLCESLFDAIKDTEYTAYLFGARPGVAEIARENMTRKYPNLKIVGVHDGYYDADTEKYIISDIQEKKPDILLVGNNFPRGEKWLFHNMDILPIKIGICIGGTIDIMAGVVKRAPAVYRKLGLEWLHRLLSDPSRLGRMKVLPLFAIDVIMAKIRGNNEK